MKYIITKNSLNREEHIVEYLLNDDNKPVEIFVNQKEGEARVGSIYTGKVGRILKNTNSCFVNIGKAEVFLKLKEKGHILYSHKYSKGEEIKEGDEIVIQIKNAGIKDKNPTGTSKISLKSDHLVLIFNERGIHCSKNLSSELKKNLVSITEEIISDNFKKYEEKGELPAIIFRSNISDILKDKCNEKNLSSIKNEIISLFTEYFSFINKASHMSPFMLLKEERMHFIDRLLNIKEKVDDIITDIPSIYDKLLKEEFLQDKNINFYEDDFSLIKLYSLSKLLKDATSRIVYLKSGANITIDQTEAFNMIDVNSSHSSNLKAKTNDDFLYKINIEAAKEISKQIRLRNLSGIIIIDFINMKDESLLNDIMRKLREYVKNDYVKVNVIDKTALSLVEITREKKYSSLKEQCQLYFNL